MTEPGDTEPSFVPPVPRIPDFDLLRPIGEGGFGQVWLAVNRTTGLPRAVKLISLVRSGDRDPAGREISSLTRLEANLRHRHPNLLAIHHVGQTAEHLFYVMDLADDVSGRPGSANADYCPATLEGRLASGPPSPEECQRWAGQLVSALACLHRAGMVHRDVKPANCLFVGGELKLADFGLLTSAGTSASRLGTVHYMPPDGRMDTRADVYAAGLVLYEMLSGQPATRFPSLATRTVDVARHPGLARLNRVVLRACQPNPEDRYRDAAEMLGDVESARPSATIERKFHRRFAWIAAILAASILCAAVGLWLRGPEKVDVNFLTEPFEAMISLDGQVLLAPDGTPYRTPCTVAGIPARQYHAVFKKEDLADLDAGTIDLRETREITARWKTPERETSNPFAESSMDHDE